MSKDDFTHDRNRNAGARCVGCILPAQIMRMQFVTHAPAGVGNDYPCTCICNRENTIIQTLANLDASAIGVLSGIPTSGIATRRKSGKSDRRSNSRHPNTGTPQMKHPRLRIPAGPGAPLASIDPEIWDGLVFPWESSLDYQRNFGQWR